MIALNIQEENAVAVYSQSKYCVHFYVSTVLLTATNI